jgi:rod shape-determining protein MreD
VSPYLTLAFLTALVAAETAVVPHTSLGLVKPLLPVLAVVSWALVRGRTPALWWAIVLGIVLDAVSPAAFGIYTVPMLAVAAVAATGRTRVFPSNVLMPGFVAAAATVAFTLTQRALLGAVEGPGHGAIAWRAGALVNDLLPVVVLNLLWLPLLYFPLRTIARRFGPPRIEWDR